MTPTATETSYTPVSGPLEDMTIKLPSGAVESEYSPRIGDTVHHGYGWEYIQIQFPGLTTHEISEILRAPNAIEQDGRYKIVIGDNPDGPGQIELWLLNGLVVSASHTVYDQTRDEHVRINDEHNVIEKILNKDDWDHSQLGATKEEVLRNLIEIVENPDEIWKDPDQDRWMYTKRMILNGRELIIVLFVMNGEVRSAFVPTHEEYAGATGYSDEYAKWYIQDQELIKKYEDEVSGGIVTQIDEGEQAEKPEEKPDPTND